MRAIWKGSIAFGLVHIPVNLYPATESQSISSNLLHKKDHSRIRYQRISEVTGKEVPAEEIVRGFEVERDNFVVISDDELKEAAPRNPLPSRSRSSSMIKAGANPDAQSRSTIPPDGTRSGLRVPSARWPRTSALPLPIILSPVCCWDSWR
jgi:hypothetical protein